MSDLKDVTNLIGPAGKPAVGTVERLAGLAKFLPVREGDRDAEYEGTTEVWWDDQRTEVGPRGGERLIDEDGNEWEAEYADGPSVTLTRESEAVSYTLTDEHGRTLRVRVEECGTFLNLRPEGYGNPVSLDFHGGRLRVLVNADRAVDEPRVIDLERAREGVA